MGCFWNQTSGVVTSHIGKLVELLKNKDKNFTLNLIFQSVYAQKNIFLDNIFFSMTGKRQRGS